MAGLDPLPPDLDAVDEPCRLALAAARLGCRVLLVDLEPALLDLLVLAGVDGLLLGVSADRPQWLLWSGHVAVACSPI